MREQEIDAHLGSGYRGVDLHRGIAGGLDCG
jgi:hypothetical protein